jgi:hypothetical protein
MIVGCPRRVRDILYCFTSCCGCVVITNSSQVVEYCYAWKKYQFAPHVQIFTPMQKWLICTRRQIFTSLVQKYLPPHLLPPLDACQFFTMSVQVTT